MLGKSPDQQPTELFKNLLPYQLNPKHALYLLSHAIAWKKLEEDLAPRYGRVGSPSHPIRKMAALLMPHLPKQAEKGQESAKEAQNASRLPDAGPPAAVTQDRAREKVMLTTTGVVKTRLHKNFINALGTSYCA